MCIRDRCGSGGGRPGLPSLMGRTVSVDVKQNWTRTGLWFVPNHGHGPLFSSVSKYSWRSLCRPKTAKFELFLNCQKCSRSVHEASATLHQVLLKASLTNCAIPDVWTLSFIYEGVAVWTRARSGLQPSARRKWRITIIKIINKQLISPEQTRPESSSGTPRMDDLVGWFN